MLRLTPLVVAFVGLACSETDAAGPLSPAGALYAKTAANASATFHLPLPATSLSLRGDGLFSDGSTVPYADKVCGVTATIFAPNPTQDGVMQTDNPSAADRSCAPYGRSAWPRKITVDYGDIAESVAGTMNVHDIGVIDGTGLRFLGIALSGSVRCAKLQFGGPTGSDSVLVSRNTSASWHVYSQPAPHNVASCVLASGAVVAYSMTVDFTVTKP